MKTNLIGLYKLLLGDNWYVHMVRAKDNDISVLLYNKLKLDKYSADSSIRVYTFRMREDGRVDIMAGPHAYE